MEKFDLKVHHRNKEGRVIRKDPYRLVIDKSGSRYERPVGSGKWFHANGEALSQEELVLRGLAQEKKLTPKTEVANVTSTEKGPVLSKS